MAELENQFLKKEGMEKGLQGASQLRPDATSKQPQKPAESGDKHNNDKK